MNNSPGWASPGSAPSDPDEPVTTPEQPEQSGGAVLPGQSQQPEQPEQAGSDHSAETDDAMPPNWSKNQPPPAPWNAPGPGPADAVRPPGGPGWGTPPPQGPAGPAGPWGGASGPGRQSWPGTPPPPAAKPGVIPLRPLAFGEILEGAFSTIRVHWRTVLSISFGVALLTQAVSTVATGLFLKNTSTSLTALQNNPDASPSDVLHTVTSAFASSGVSTAISVIGQLVATAMLTIIVSRSVLGRPVTAGDAWRESGPRLLRLLAMTVIVGVVAALVVAVGATPGILLAVFGSAAGGAALAVLGGLAGLIVAVWLLIRLSLATPALMLEKQSVFASLTRSAKLVRGAWWRVFGIQLLASIIVFVITSMIAIPFTAVGAVLGGDGAQTLLANGTTPTSWPFLVVIGIGTVIGTTITFPISAGVTALLYMDQRIRREGLDIELARAAGVPGY
ncbi:hypothetical protein NGB36_31240 [Streptomyces sp. RB6PN25]|uniref:Glycerophosphoryl diester phosphodiesterase membrane domain-containing protein n=1 Tax=Streptomyces humicola TaxID=2953240 RepID=A0ABT1Q6A6_9ACTN|nr:hypothetical protein [Streptomyces humicola]MCQ4084923.1 hypothetical protein [Streptomyces humicola]